MIAGRGPLASVVMLIGLCSAIALGYLEYHAASPLRMKVGGRKGGGGSTDNWTLTTG